MNANNYQGWEVVPEEMIAQAAEMAENAGGFGEMDNTNFRKILAAGGVYRIAGLTPIYVWDEPTHRLAVYAEELQEKPFLIN